MIGFLTKNKSIRNAVLSLTFALSAYANAGEIEVVFLDDTGVGFNSQESYAPVGGNNATTLGEARKNVLYRAIRMVESQVNIKTNFAINVKFKVLGGDVENFDAITSGPTFIFHNQHNGNPYGILESSRLYPSNLISTLQSTITKSSPISTTIFSLDTPFYLGFDNNSQERSFISTVLHELVHVMGFAKINCFSSCLPKPISKPSHFTKFVFAQGEPLVAFDELSIDEQEAVASSSDGLLFLGSAATQSKLTKLLTGGVHDGAVELHADGESDGQKISHFSPNVQPTQLMASDGANVQDFGAAAYILCDIGWCRESGQVIDIALDLVGTQFKARPGRLLNVDFVIHNNTNTAVDNIKFETRFPEAITLSDAFLENGECAVLEDTLMSCSVNTIRANESLDVHFTLSGNIGEYQLSGELSSTSFDVDSHGSNNLFDIEFVVQPNTPPSIELGDTMRVNEGETVSISASSYDEDNDDLTHSWVQLSGPKVELSDENTLDLMFIAPEISQDSNLVFKLTVFDGEDEVSSIIDVSVLDLDKENTKQAPNDSGGSFGWVLLSVIGFCCLEKHQSRK